MWRNTILLVVVTLAGTSLHAARSSAAEPPQENDPLTPAMPYQAQKSDPVTHDVDFAIIVTPPYHCEILKVWVPVPRSDKAQEITNRRFHTFPENVKPRIETEPVHGNQFAYFEFHNPRGAQIIHHRFTAKIWNLHWNLSSEQVTRVAEWPKSFAPYLKTPLVKQEQAFQNVLRKIAPDSGQSDTDIKKVMAWVDQHMTYDHVNASLRADANHALAQRRGHCSDYHGLCATLGRMLGYPTRVTYGLAMFPKNSPSHCKMEAFLPQYGWVSFDVSETQKMVHAIEQDGELSESEKESLITAARERFHSGFRENSWLLMTKGTNYELAPQASGPVPVVRTAYIEADGKPLPDPDPANAEQRTFSWMTAHKYTSDKPVVRPFKDFSTLSTD